MSAKHSELPTYTLFALSEQAIVIEFGQAINDEIHNCIMAFAATLQQQPFQGFVEYIPAFTTLTVYYDPWIVSDGGNKDASELVKEYIDQLSSTVQVSSKLNPRKLTIPVCYGGAYGPDIQFVADQAGLSLQAVIDIHASTDYKVYMIGFAPGFPYLGGMDSRIASPRKNIPRPVIPAGSVGIAGTQTGIYPIETPGGWQLIGRTPLALFNPEKEPYSYLQAGDSIRFIPILEKEFLALKKGTSVE
ncbi:5-oxoprolinase subunit PxpB [Rhodocytophaga aerolata]|uniref:5-oxoprolinase subunit PxpB n=1 Tax=Rhodocytophaga aerolata TaxID=455078 RepID=A0ABT8RE53_9BACT|nr:5-oxoprolinase subunit PxpB [Rhodocytophaga aerolata]MDO1450381.1 5-oxoprolinase subunit PxpB [Rhodocytophaga aerolata]